MALVNEQERPVRRFAQFRADIPADGGMPTITCDAVAWGSRNSYGEVFVPGAFAEDLATHSDRKPIVMGLYHDRAIGRWASAVEMEVALRLGGQVSDTSDGRDAAVLVKDGALTGVSIGFWEDDYQFAAANKRVTFQTPLGERSYMFDQPTWYVLKARILEASLVMCPSDDEARVVTARSKVARALPALRGDGASWDDVAYSMALLMGARGAGEFAELPDGERRALYVRLVDAYATHDKTPPAFAAAPAYADVAFAHDERQIFHETFTRKRMADVVAGLRGLTGPVNDETYQAALGLRDALSSLQRAGEGALLARMREQLAAAAQPPSGE